MPIESARPNRQSEGEPIVEDARLPYMQHDGARPSELMPPQDRLVDTAGTATLPPPLAVNQEEGPTERMAAFNEDDGEHDAPYGKGDQRQRDVPAGKAKGYVRLRVRLENGELSVIGARAVEGPLAFDESLDGELVYEVRAGRRRIGIGTVPDAGEMRSFPPPEPREGQIGHHVVPLPATEFNVRIPAEDLPPAALEHLSIDVYQMKERPERPYLSAEPLAEQYGKDARLVAQLRGVETQKLEPRVRDDLKRALR